MEANSSYLWDAELRRGNAGTWDSSVELIATCFANVPADIREVRVRADAGFGINPVFDALESHSAEYAVVARMTPSLKRSLTELRYSPVNRDWEMAELQHRPQSWSRARRFVVARRLLSADERQPTLFALGRYAYRAWVTNLSLTPLGVWHFYDARATIEPRIASCSKITRYAKFPRAPSPPMHCSWKSFASPTIWSPRSNDSACKNPGNVSLFPSYVTSSSCCPANSPGRRIVPYCGSESPPCCRP